MSVNQVETVAVTGATGFIGRALLRQLNSCGYRARVLVRPQSLKALQSSAGVEVVAGHLGDEQALERLVAGAQAVIHCAGMVRDGRGAFQATNVEGMRLLARVVAGQSHRPKLLSLSSLAAREPGLSAYAASKLAGEKALIQELSNGPFVILRPPAVYGPGDRELRPLFEWMMRGIAPILGSPQARFSLIFVDDLAECLVNLLDEPRVDQGIFELHDGKTSGYGWDDVGKAITALSGRPQRRLRLPASLATVIAGTNLMAQRLCGGAPMFTPGKVRELQHSNWVCDDRPLLAATNWRPKVQLEVGLRQTLLPATQPDQPTPTEVNP